MDMTRYPCGKTDDCGLDVECVDCNLNPDARFEHTLTVEKDGDSWCALFGINLQEGIAGFGDTREKAIIKLGNALQEQSQRGDASVVKSEE